MSRSVILVVLGPDGTPAGELPPLQVASSWWPEVAEVVAAAQDHHALTVRVLRLLHTDTLPPHGGAGRYLVEADSGSADLLQSTGLLQPTDVRLTDDPRRAAYARPGGPTATLAWASGARGPFTTVEQRRTWNLSALWRLTTPDAAFWLKQVPAFFAHEPAVIDWVAARSPGLVPRLLAHDGAGRMLLAEAPGEDRYGADAAERSAIAAAWHPVQLASVAALDDLLALGVPDRRAAPLAAEFDARFGRSAHARLAALTECGLPDTLVHGDLHSGNVVGDTIIDWGDAVIGHPGLDALRLAEGLADPAPLLDAWCAQWRASVPGSDPRRALELLRPVYALFLAATYARFLDAIEESERCYHILDVPTWLDRATALGG